MDLAKKAGERAFEYHSTGFHCGEAVCQAVAEAFDVELNPLVIKACTAFGGKVAKSPGGICGALNGGMVILGVMYGRDKKGEDWDDCARVANSFQRRFEEEFHSKKCTDILDKFGQQKNMLLCRKLSGQTAEMLVEIINGHIE